jgi:hypothetical protein
VPTWSGHHPSASSTRLQRFEFLKRVTKQKNRAVFEIPEILKKSCPEPLALARGSVSASESAGIFPGRDCEGAGKPLFQQPG